MSNCKEEIQEILSLLSIYPLTNLMETLRMGKAIELLWQVSSSTGMDIDARTEMFSKSVEKRLELMREEQEQLMISKEVRNEVNPKNSRKGSFDKPKSTRNSNKKFVIQSLNNNKFSKKNTSNELDRYMTVNSEDQNTSLKESQELWKLDDVGDIDHFDKVIQIKSFKKKKKGGVNTKASVNSRYRDEDQSGEERDFSPVKSNIVNKLLQQEDFFDHVNDTEENSLIAQPVEEIYRKQRREDSKMLIRTIAHMALNLVKHQNKRNEIQAKALMKHKDEGYQMIRKHFKKIEKEVNMENDVELFIERFCLDPTRQMLIDFKKGKFKLFVRS